MTCPDCGAVYTLKDMHDAGDRLYGGLPDPSNREYDGLLLSVIRAFEKDGCTALELSHFDASEEVVPWQVAN